MSRPLWVAPLVLVLILCVAALGTATASPQRGVSGVSATVPAPVSGKVVNCTSTEQCVYALHTRLGAGWANSTLTATSTEQMALKLPGESKISHNLSYSTYTEKVTTNYPNTTYWTVGNFLGTDVNSGHIVLGTTNTNYTAICHKVFRWCHYTYATDNGTIIVRFTAAEVTSTALTCSPTSTQPGGKVACSVKVTNGWNASNTPTGSVKISDGATGTLSDKGTCVLTKGACSFVYHPADETCGTVTIVAAYPGTAAFYKSAASTPISVIVSGGC